MTTRVVNCRIEEPDVFIGRPGRWGNPFSHRYLPGTIKVSSKAEAIRQHRAAVLADPNLVAEIKTVMTGKVLGCYCTPGSGCHGDTYVDICEGRLP